MRARAFPGVIAVLVAYFVFQLLAVRSDNFSADPGVGWHLASGEWIVAHLKIPRMDPFLAVARPWVCDQWLADVIFYFVAERSGGVRDASGLANLSALLFAIYLFTFFGVLTASIGGASLADCGVGRIGQAGGVFFAATAALLHCIMRPVIFGFLLFALTQFCLKRCSRWRTPMLIAIFLLWANMHPSFILGLLLVWIYLGQTLTPWIVTLVTCLNPNGLNLHASILELGQSAYFMRLNTEWLPAASGGIEEAIFLLAIMLIACAEVLHRRAATDTLSSVIELVLVTIFAAAFLRSIRFLPFFGLVAAAPLARSIEFILGRIGICFGKGIRRAGAAFASFENERCFSLNVGCVAALMLIVSAASERGVPFANNTFLPPKDKYPYGALDALAGKSGVVVAPPDWGGFITWYSKSQLRPVLDDRNSLLGEQAYRDFFYAMRGATSLASYVNAERADYLVLPANSQALQAARSNLELQCYYADELSAVFVRTIGRDPNTGILLR